VPIWKLRYAAHSTELQIKKIKTIGYVL